MQQARDSWTGLIDGPWQCLSVLVEQCINRSYDVSKRECSHQGHFKRWQYEQYSCERYSSALGTSPWTAQRFILGLSVEPLVETMNQSCPAGAETIKGYPIVSPVNLGYDTPFESRSQDHRQEVRFADFLPWAAKTRGKRAQLAPLRQLLFHTFSTIKTRAIPAPSIIRYGSPKQDNDYPSRQIIHSSDAPHCRGLYRWFRSGVPGLRTRQRHFTNIGSLG